MSPFNQVSNDHAYGLYAQGLYCNEALQKQPRPSRWYTTPHWSNSISPSCSITLQKFRWVSLSAIMFEGSYSSPHRPINPIDPLAHKSTLYLEHSPERLPFGVRTFASMNRSYWNACAKQYLIAYVSAIASIKLYGDLLTKLRDQEWEPCTITLKSYEDSYQRALSGKDLAKLSFKLCRQYAKSQFGLITHSQLPEPVKKAKIMVNQLKCYYKNQSHNRVLVTNAIESYLESGLEKYIRHVNSHILGGVSLSEFGYSNLPISEKLDYLQAILTERCCYPRISNDELISDQYEETNVLMAFNYGFIDKHYSARPELLPIINMAQKFNERSIDWIFPEPL